MRDPLGPSRGMANAVLLGIGAWMLIGCFVWMVVR